MNERFERLKSALLEGASVNSDCQCDDSTTIIRGMSQVQTFNLPFKSGIISQLLLIYKQNGFIILRKSLEDMTVSQSDSSLLFFEMSEQESLLFSESSETVAQMKILLKSGDMIMSDPLFLAVETPSNLSEFMKPDFIAFKAEAVGNILKIKEQVSLYTGASSMYKCRLLFDESWSDLALTITFKDEHSHVISVPVESSCIEIPYKVLEKPGRVNVLVTGTSDNQVKTTCWSNSFYVNSGTPAGE